MTRTVRPAVTRRIAWLLLALIPMACQSPDVGEVGTAATSPRDALLARAASFELDTEYVPPPGDALEHHTSGFAKILCSAIFITGLDPDFAAESVGYFTSPYEARAKVADRVIDRENQAVHLTLPSGVTRTAKFLGDQGCVTLPIGEDSVYFTRVDVESALPDASTELWPMGDVLPEESFPSELDEEKVAQAVDAAFEPGEGMTTVFLVTWKGRIIGERYGDGITMHTALESWSMGKSLTATLMGVLIQQDVYDLWQPAPVPEWQADGDPRAEIRIADILRMPTSTPHSVTLIICMFMPVALTRLSGPPRDPSSGRPTRWGGIATPTLCSSITWSVSLSKHEARNTSRFRNVRSSTRSVSATWCLRRTHTGTSCSRVTNWDRRVTGHGSATSTSRTGCGWANGFCPKGMPPS